MTGILGNLLLFTLIIIIQAFLLNDYGFYDLLLVAILFYFTTLKNQSKFKALILAIVAGYIKDSTSGGVFGVYISSYTWYFLMLYTSSMFLNINNYVFMLFLGVLGIITEGVFIFVSNYTWVFTPELGNELYKLFLTEIILALFTFLPFYFLFVFLRRVFININKGVKEKVSMLSRI